MKILQENLLTLRKRQGITQGELAKHLGVSFQSVSKWETGISLPDISLLTNIAEFYEITTDQLLGLMPLKENTYKKRMKGTAEYRDKILKQFQQSRRLYWNDDYLAFLINDVWKIRKAVKVAEVACGDGSFAKQLLPLLPEGSTYIGFEKSNELRSSSSENDNVSLLDFQATSDYQSTFDVVLCQGYLRHETDVNQCLIMMKSLAKTNGLVIAHEENRPFETAGLFLDDGKAASVDKDVMLNKIWQKELREESRDYRIGLRLPIILKALNFKSVDCRMNDRVNTVLKSTDDQELLNCINDHYALTSITEDEFQSFLLTRGLTNYEALRYMELYHHRKDFMHQDASRINLVHLVGLMISWGYK